MSKSSARAPLDERPTERQVINKHGTTEDDVQEGNNITLIEKLLRFLDPIRRWRSTWRKLIVVMLITIVVAVPAAIAVFLLTGVAFHFLGFAVLGQFFSLAIAVAVVIILPAITMSYCTHGPEQQWKWDWRSIGKWMLATSCILFMCISAVIAGNVLDEKWRDERRAARKATEYSSFIERKFSESEAVNGQRSPVKLIQFRPAAIKKKHRVILHFDTPYEIPRTSNSTQSGVFHPEAELRVLTATGSIIKTTNTVEAVSFHAMSGSWKEGMQEGLRSEMTLEFTPQDLDDYSIDFIGPPKGFAEYKLTIEAQGIE